MINMNRIKFYLTALLSVLLSACISNAWTGANMIYDRHHLYKKSNDIKLSAKVGHAPVSILPEAGPRDLKGPATMQ